MSDKTPTLKEQYDEEINALESAIAELLIGFTERTGFVVEDVTPYFHDYRTSKTPSVYYSVSVVTQG